MNILGNLFRSRDKPQNRTAGSAYLFLNGTSSSGKPVNERSAMQMTAVYSCVRILSEALAGLPLHLYRYREDGGKEKANDHPLYHLLHDEPNPEMSSFVFRETLMTHLLLWGNAYAQIIRNGKGEVIASSLDRDIESHVRLSQLMIERCKRLAENGQHVVLLLDSITRLARAFNKWVGNTGRTMSGGVDIKAMDIPKKLFATARQFENIEIDGEVREGGSLTIIGTALIETGSRMDELIFQEFKGTGNMELVLDRRLADRRIWPAMDVSMSGTRREEKLLNPEVLHAVTLLRRTLASMNPTDAMEQLTQKLLKYKSNAEFLTRILQVRE